MRKLILIILVVLLIAFSLPVYAGGSQAGTGYHVRRGHQQASGGKSQRAERGLRRAAQRSKAVVKDKNDDDNGDFDTGGGSTL